MVLPRFHPLLSDESVTPALFVFPLPSYPQVRQQLTKRHCQEEIQRRTGTVLIVRGRYYPPGMPVDDRDKPLFLRISPTVAAGDTDEEKQRAVDAAAGEVQKILQGQQQVHRGAARSGPPQVRRKAWKRAYSSTELLPPQLSSQAHLSMIRKSWPLTPTILHKDNSLYSIIYSMQIFLWARVSASTCC
jgi:hypothetical protein